MLFKIDENLHEDVAEVLRTEGYDAVSVHDQGLRGHSDEEIAEVCRREGRVIVTQDLDFSNIVAYPPEDYAGIIVLRLRDSSCRSSLAVIRRLLPLLTTSLLSGHLWTWTKLVYASVPVDKHYILLEESRGDQRPFPEMVFPVAAVIAFLSRWITLEPGDIIATGTPSGVSSASGTFLKPGDLIRATIATIGTLETPVEGEDA